MGVKRASSTPAPGQAALPGFDDPAAPLSDDGDPDQDHTLFFALRPDAATIDAIAARRLAICASHGFDGKAIDPERLHITLHFVGRNAGGLPAAMVEGARAVADGLVREPFDVVLDGIVSFDTGQRRLPLVLLASKQANRPLMLFQQRIAAAMAAIGLKSPAGPGFTPYLTLLYDDRRIAQQAIEPVGWTVREFVLIESLPGRGVHRTLGCWPVNGAG